MKMNQDMIKGKWTELKGELQKAWGKITNDEWEQTKGDLTAIRGLIRQKYGQEKGDELDRIAKKYESVRDQATDSVKARLKS